jgi:hypothetical protein
MRTAPVCLIVGFAACVAAANPYVATIISEVGFHSDRTAWIELHDGPFSQQVDLSGWRIVTSTSECTLDYVIRGWEYFVVDSALLADGWYARGTFRLDSATDLIRVYPDTSTSPYDRLSYHPGSPNEPVPSLLASTAVWNTDCYAGQTFTHYADSTPTPGCANDNFCTIQGQVSVGPGETLYEVDVGAHGPAGGGWAGGSFYRIFGLPPGRYSVECYAYVRGGGSYHSIYPESVDVGYSQTVSGIDFSFPPSATAEGGGRDGRPDFRGQSLLLGAAWPQLYDVQGRCVTQPKPGVYFTREPGAADVRKVIIAR